LTLKNIFRTSIANYTRTPFDSYIVELFLTKIKQAALKLK